MVGETSELPENARVSNYINRLIAGDFDNKTKGEIAEILDIDYKTLWRWNQKVDWAYVTAEKRKLYAKDILDIDQAMMREGKKGNTAAAELAYRRFDGWVPASKIALEQQTDAELLEEAAKLRAEQEAKSGSAGTDLPGAGTPEAA